MIPLNSSSIRAVDYRGGTLFVQFHTSDTFYSHPHVPYSLFEGLINADSPGGYYNQFIRGKFK